MVLQVQQKGPRQQAQGYVVMPPAHLTCLELFHPSLVPSALEADDPTTQAAFKGSTCLLRTEEKLIIGSFAHLLQQIKMDRKDRMRGKPKVTRRVRARPASAADPP